MPELSAERVWKPAWAEKYFDNHSEAFDFYERRRSEHPSGRVHRPVRDQENRGHWVVCVGPV